MIFKCSSEYEMDVYNVREYFYSVINIIQKEFIHANYGEDIIEVFTLLICTRNANNFNIRKRYYTPERLITIDCILNYYIVLAMSENDQKIYLLKELKKTFSSIQTYSKKLKGFNFISFEKDIQCFLDKLIGGIPIVINI